MIAAAASALVVAADALGGDAPAHLYRTYLVREGIVLWDAFWYSGHYPLASYGVAYYLPALLGNVPVVAAAAVASAALFASLALREWGDAAVWPARVFAVLAAGPLVSGTYAYALGAAGLLATLRALQAGRAATGIGLAALTLAMSPLAFVFLCLALLAVGVARRRLDRQVAAVGISVAALAVGTAVVVRALFPADGRYPFETSALALALALGVALTALALRAKRGPVLAAFFAFATLACLVSFAVSSPLGGNVTRLRFVVLPLALLAAVLARFRPRPLAVGAVALAAAVNVLPYGELVPKVLRKVSHEERAWAPVLAFLERRATRDFRVEVVPTAAHWETYFFPRAGLALARGWHRQIDLADNEDLYDDRLSPSAYRAWLRRAAVRFVVLPRSFPLERGGRPEARLLRSGRSGLVPVLRTRRFAVYALPRARPLLTGPGRARVTALEHDRIEGWTSAPGRYVLRVTYTPYWRIRAGSLCVAPAGKRTTALHASAAGAFVLATPNGARAIAGALAGQAWRAARGRGSEPRCAGRPAAIAASPRLH